MKQFDSVDDILEQVKTLSEEQENEQSGSLPAPEDPPKEKPAFKEDVSFALTQQEAYLCLKKAGIFKTSGKRAVIYTVLMSIAAVGFFVSYLAGQNGNWLVLAILSLIVIAVVWVVPYVQLKRLARANANGAVIKARITQEKIIIMGNESSWEIPLNKKSRLSLGDNMLIFYTENKQLFAIPERAVQAENLQAVKEMVQNGTLPDEE